MRDENDKVRDSINKLLETGLKSSKDMFQKNLQSREDWLLEHANYTNQTKLKQTNHNYLFSLGEKSISHNLSLQASFRDFSRVIFVGLLMNKLRDLPSQQISTTDTGEADALRGSKRAKVR